jgi:hypothetical protein
MVLESPKPASLTCTQHIQVPLSVKGREDRGKQHPLCYSRSRNPRGRSGHGDHSSIQHHTWTQYVDSRICQLFFADPPLVLTALFASCGMGFVTFTIAVFVALPRQLVTVYFGYALASKDAAGRACTFFLSYLALWLMFEQMNLKPKTLSSGSLSELSSRPRLRQAGTWSGWRTPSGLTSSTSAGSAARSSCRR